MKLEAQELVSFVLQQVGFQPPLLETATQLLLQMFEERQVGLWQLKNCTGCRHDPGDCAFFPKAQSRRIRLHRTQITWNKEVPCDAREAVEQGNPSLPGTGG